MNEKYAVDVIVGKDEVITFAISSEVEMNHLHYSIKNNINFFSYKQGETLHYLNLNRVIEIRISSVDGDVVCRGNI